MINYEYLSSHPLMKQNFGYIKPVLDKLSPKLSKYAHETGKIHLNENSTSLDFAESYHVAVFQKASAFITALERLEHSLKYIHKFPSPRTYEKQGITQYSWLEYHYSYFVVTYQSLSDIGLILTNTVFDLGIPEKDCTPQNIKNNAFIKDTPVKPSLKALEKAISSYKSKRHLFVHRGELPDIRSVTESDILDMLKVFSMVHQHSEPIVPLDLIDDLYRKESIRITSALNEDITKARKAITHLFDSLLPTYTKKSQAYLAVVLVKNRPRNG